MLGLEKILQDLKKSKSYKRKGSHHNNTKSDRTGITLEPFLTEQWYLKSDILKTKR